ncbi:AraC family transcriptional regulator [Photobacterium atrarenae]|uniref:Helix-turn-helix transcriptional regulator n=1 Tax=Photobacterium atrarenae TaxID=865757 RepID=A0ABY5GNB9_9GAMM|nr:helix-turn-helix transcriptional regulator [Photobacterium atrarenae]UTV30833.1 helix-turn-helix transcriptional regulator [Photobacterium atrarenae]
MTAQTPLFSDVDNTTHAVDILYTQADERVAESPYHQHRKGQLVMPTCGSVTSRIKDAIWIVPPYSAVWIPGDVPHSNQLTPEGEGYMLFIEPDAADMPDQVCTLSVSPLIREILIALAARPQDYPADSPTARLVQVLLDELPTMPREQFDFPIPQEPRLNQIATALLTDPADRRTMAQWASAYAMSEKTLSRLVKQQTGLTFGNWRKQLHIVVALQQLTSGNPVQQVSEQLGYESVSAFITFFKKTLGRPPKQYMAAR